MSARDSFPRLTRWAESSDPQDEAARIEGRRALVTIQQLAGTINDLTERVRCLETEGTPGVMHAVDKAFYDLTVTQRDAVWREVESLRERVIRAGQHAAPRNALIRKLYECAVGITLTDDEAAIIREVL